jgi:hypothetical protein
MTMTREQLDAAREGIRALLAAMPPHEPAVLDADDDEGMQAVIEATWLDMDAQLATLTAEVRRLRAFRNEVGAAQHNPCNASLERYAAIESALARLNAGEETK